MKMRHSAGWPDAIVIAAPAADLVFLSRAVVMPRYKAIARPTTFCEEAHNQLATV